MIAKERDKGEKHPRSKKKKLFTRGIIEIEELDEAAGSKIGVKLCRSEKTQTPNTDVPHLNLLWHFT